MYKNKLVKNSTEGDIAPALCEMTTVCNVGEAKPGHGACMKSMSRTYTRPDNIYTCIGSYYMLSRTVIERTSIN